MQSRRKYPLVVVTGRLGACSETFIKRHMYELSPGDAVGVATFRDPNDYCWDAPGPYLVLGSQRSAKARRLIGRHTRWLESLTGVRLDYLGLWQKQLKDFLSMHNVGVGLGEFLDVSHPFLRVFQEMGIPFYAHAHGYDVSTNLRSPVWVRRYRDYNESEGIITMSRASRDRLVNIGICPRKIHVVRYGVDVPATCPMEDRSANERVVRMLAVGRLVPKKGPLLLLESFRLAVKEYPAICLDLVGDGPMLDRVLAYVHENDLMDKVALHGRLDNQAVKDLMTSADVFLQHSVLDPNTGDEEGLPVAILEAMAHGLPVVSTRHAGIPEEVSEGETGFLVEETDTVAMAQRMLELAKDSEKRRAFGYAGWSRASTDFCWELEKNELKSLLGLGTETTIAK